MHYRALIFDDDKMIREFFQMLFEKRGYDVVTYHHPLQFPLFDTAHCPCSEECHCTDVIISDMNMPFQNGLDFIEELITKGCHCSNIAVMSATFGAEHVDRGKSLGLTIFSKPIHLLEIHNWLDQIEKNIAPSRRLLDFS